VLQKKLEVNILLGSKIIPGLVGEKKHIGTSMMKAGFIKV
jgi:hypothetical protein